ncbi:nucleotidyltransferase domain-containing protein [Streptomyces sp. V4I2]|uniref:nucleotidyltransferase domain-containing protein n=1 Tax=Streptomyces sp. V4I2 TaxID=3042280 RepID=UPI0027D90052|nr:nucleotidyltransferase domain-containing protein [Streptomyces sp. V4I2]
MKRERATALVEDMLRRLDKGTDWPLTLVDEIHLFGSYARGALQPHDVDVAVDVRRDERMTQHVVACLFSGRSPYSELRGQLVGGRSRGIQLQFDTAQRMQLESEGVPMLRLWRRGDTFQHALQILRGIEPDPEAGRAPRDDMIEEFEGLDRAIPRPVRHDLISWRNTGQITISRIRLPDQPAEPVDRDVAIDLRTRWVDHSPLRRAALAALHHLQEQGVDFSDVELSGYRLPTPSRMAGRLEEARWWVNWKWQHYRSIPYCLDDGDGWLEVLAPTRTRSLHALLFTPGPTPART